MDFTRIESMRELILQDQVSNQVLQVDEQVYIVREYESIQFQTFAPSPKPYAYEVGLDTSELNLPEAEAKLIYSWVPASSKETAAYSSSATDVFLDLDQLILPLVVRSRRSGDRFEPLWFKWIQKSKGYVH